MSSTRKAATAVLVREGETGPEVLLLKRSSHGFFGDMWVFPGGAIDTSDYAGTDEEFEAARIAAIRETAEETGISLTGLELLPFAHWTPPKEIPSRYLTWFFMVQLDCDQPVVIDEHEIIDHGWVDAGWAIEQHQQGVMAMAPPTVVTLTEITRHGRCSEMLAFYGTRGICRYIPRFVKTANGDMVSLYQGDAGYESGKPDLPGDRNRLFMRKGICIYEATSVTGDSDEE